MAGSLREVYGAQKRGARRAGVLFLISFEDWLDVWQRSGHLPLRGRGLGKYHMARCGGRGAFEVGNVRIIPHEQNSHDTHLGRVKLEGELDKMRVRATGNKYGIGFRHTEEFKKRLSEERKGAGNPFFGKKHARKFRHSDEARAKMRAAWKKRKSA